MQGHTFAVENFDIVGQAENVGILVVISGRSLDVGPVGEVDGNQSFGCGQFYDFGTGSRLVNILSQKIVDLVVLVRNVKNRIFNMELFQFALFGTGDVQFKITGVFL